MASGEFWQVRRDAPTRRRLPETPEAGVVCLITQRSQVQIVPPLPLCPRYHCPRYQVSAGQRPDRLEAVRPS